MWALRAVDLVLCYTQSLSPKYLSPVQYICLIVLNIFISSFSVKKPNVFNRTLNNETMTAVKSQPHKTAGYTLKRILHVNSTERKSFSHPTNTNKDLYLLPNNDIRINCVYSHIYMCKKPLNTAPMQGTNFNYLCAPVLLSPKLSIPY